MQSTEVDDKDVLLCEVIPVLLYLCLFIYFKQELIYLFISSLCCVFMLCLYALSLCCVFMSEMNTRPVHPALLGTKTKTGEELHQGGLGLSQRGPGIVPVGPPICCSKSMNLPSLNAS
jgi:hypothetical protein